MMPSTNIPDEKLQNLLERILNSKSFEGVDRLKRFLRFIVAETSAGRGDQLKEFTVGEQVFDKGADFDPRCDPIVRVQAGRLRARLTRSRFGAAIVSMAHGDGAKTAPVGSATWSCRGRRPS